MILDPYIRRARHSRVVDGDTLDLHIDCGFHHFTDQRVRLLGVNVPEPRSPDPEERQRAAAATAWVAQWLEVPAYPLATRFANRWPLRVRTFKDDSFGRWLAVVFSVHRQLDLASALLEAGLAVPDRPEQLAAALAELRCSA